MTVGSERLLRTGLALVSSGPALILIVLMVTLSLTSPYFLTERNLTNLGFQTAAVACLALGQLFVILTRGIDLSVGSLIALAGVVGATIGATAWGGSMVAVIAGALLVSLAVGLVNGGVFVWGRIPHPFIVTLAMLSAARGLALLISGGNTLTTVPAGVVTVGSGTVGRIPVSVIVVACLAALSYLLLAKTQWGRWIYAVGGDPEAARRVGIPVKRVLLSVYAISGLAAGAAGVILMGRTAAGDPNAGQLLELDAITAVIIGGASFFGGRGNVANVVVGALILGVIRNGLDLLSVSPFWQLVATGVIIVASVELDVLRGRLEERFRSLQGSRMDPAVGFATAGAK